jgi:predicted transcriptional regulator
MAKTKTKDITILQSKGAFSILKKGFFSKASYDFTDLSALRKLLSNEKARVLYIIKTENPISIYDLAKKLGRDFKTVNEDIKLLEKFGFLKLKAEKTKNRKRLRPELVSDVITIHLKL